MRNLVLVLGDQLNQDSAAFDGFDQRQDAVWMAEVAEEATHVWCHKLRIALFFSAMRHFRDELAARGCRIHYTEMPERPELDRGRDFATVLHKDLLALTPQKLILVQPGDFRVLQSIRRLATEMAAVLELRPDRHFYCDTAEFAEYAAGKKQLILENFYRRLRKKHSLLISANGKPAGGAWNFDRQNRHRFSEKQLHAIPRPASFLPDAITRQVLELVSKRFRDHPGSLEHFNLPVTRDQALAMLSHFIESGLPQFGPYQDAMWMDEPFLFHSRLSSSLNLKLIDPRECVEAAVSAYAAGAAPIESVEGFVRQILGWREFIRGVYWHFMPGYADLNHLDHQLDLPSFYWDGRTNLHCFQQTLRHVLRHAYSHHIERLMVVGLFSLLFGCHPKQFHEWHMAMYADAIDWVSLPNTLGMSQYGDGGLVGTKPYCATGNYINRMSNYCGRCRYDHRQAAGDAACPFTTLYWDFLDGRQEWLKNNRRMQIQLQNLADKRHDAKAFLEIKRRAEQLRRNWSEILVDD